MHKMMFFSVRPYLKNADGISDKIKPDAEAELYNVDVLGDEQLRHSVLITYGISLLFYLSIL